MRGEQVKLKRSPPYRVIPAFAGITIPANNHALFPKQARVAFAEPVFSVLRRRPGIDRVLALAGKIHFVRIGFKLLLDPVPQHARRLCFPLGVGLCGGMPGYGCFSTRARRGRIAYRAA